MNSYEVCIEYHNPCGGTHNKSALEIIEVEAESPEAYIRDSGRYPVLDISQTPSGDTVILTGDGHGYFAKYTFTL